MAKLHRGKIYACQAYESKGEDALGGRMKAARSSVTALFVDLRIVLTFARTRLSVRRPFEFVDDNGGRGALYFIIIRGIVVVCVGVGVVVSSGIRIREMTV